MKPILKAASCELNSSFLGNTISLREVSFSPLWPCNHSNPPPMTTAHFLIGPSITPSGNLVSQSPPWSSLIFLGCCRTYCYVRNETSPRGPAEIFLWCGMHWSQRAKGTTTLCDGNETLPIISSILTHKRPTPPLIGSGMWIQNCERGNFLHFLGCKSETTENYGVNRTITWQLAG